jgi:hypothetical protein
MLPVKDHCQREKRCSKKKCPENCKDYRDTHIRRRKEKKDLLCELTPKELQENADALARAFEDLQLAEADEKEMKKQFAASKSELEAKIAKLAALQRAKKEMRAVAIEITTDYGKKTVAAVRQDTGATVEERKLNKDEEQRHMDFMEQIDAERKAAQAAKKKKGKGGDKKQQTPNEANPTDDELRGLFGKAIAVFKKAGTVKTAILIRRMKLTQLQAIRLLELMEGEGLVTPAKPGGGRDLLAK